MKNDSSPVLQFWRVNGDRNTGGPCATVFMGPTQMVGERLPKCKGCGRLIEERSHKGIEIHAEGASAKVWPDFLFGFKLVISQRVLADLQSNELTGFVPHPVTFDKIDSPKLQKLSRPQYFLLELTGHLNVNRDLFDEWEGNECPVCHNWVPKEGGKYFYGARTLFPEMATWDGSDFVHIHSPAIGGHFCTTRIIELARAKKWVGAHFESITPRPYFVNLKSNKWLDEIAKKARAEYPQLLT